MQPTDPQQQFQKPVQPPPAYAPPQPGYFQPPMVPAPPRKKGWWSRNAAWFIPTLVVVVLGSCGGCIFGIFQLVFGFIKGSDVYQDALAKARSSAAVVAELGEPIEERGFPTGKVSYQNASGSADLQIPIRGPKADATIHVVATRAMGKWSYSTLIVVVTGSDKQIDLNAADGG